MQNPRAHSNSGLGRTQVRNTTCYRCACRCAIRASLRDGQVRYIQGKPEYPSRSIG